jgi:hypothetical protein
VATAPNWAEITTAVGSALTGLTLGGVVFTAWLGLKQWKGSRHDRQVNVITNLGLRWDDPRLEESRAQCLRYDSGQLANRIAAFWARRDHEDPRLSRILLDRLGARLVSSLANRPPPETEEYHLLLRIPNFFEDVRFSSSLQRWRWVLFGVPSAASW